MKKYKSIIPIIIMGCAYLLIELIWRALMGDMVGFRNMKYMSMTGWTSLWMFWIGGISGFLISKLNNKPSFYNKKIIYQCLIGTIIILVIEYFFGYVANIIFQLNLWSYHSLPLNLNGQISLLYGFLWFWLCPLAIWSADMIDYFLFNIGEFYSLWSLYKDLVTLK